MRERTDGVRFCRGCRIPIDAEPAGVSLCGTCREWQALVDDLAAMTRPPMFHPSTTRAHRKGRP